MQKIEETSNNNNGDNNNSVTTPQKKTPLIGKLNGKRIFVKDSKNPPVTFKDFKNSNNNNNNTENNGVINTTNQNGIAG